MMQLPRYFIYPFRMLEMVRVFEERTAHEARRLQLTDAARADTVAALRLLFEDSGLSWHDNVYWVASPEAAERLAAYCALQLNEQRSQGTLRRLPFVSFRRRCQSLGVLLNRLLIALGTVGLVIGIGVGVCAALGGCVEAVIKTQARFQPSIFGAIFVPLCMLHTSRVRLERRYGELIAKVVIHALSAALVLGATSVRLSGRLEPLYLGIAKHTALALAAVGVACMTIPELTRRIRDFPRLYKLQFGSSFAAERIHRRFVWSFQTAFAFEDHLTLARALWRHRNVATLVETHIEGSISRVAQLDPEVYKAAQAVVSRRMKRGKTWTPSSVDADVLGRHRIPHFAYLQNECIALDLLAKNGMHSIDQAMQRRARTYLAATTGGCIWPHRDFVIVAEPPISMELEGERTQRLHCATGAAMLWSDGAAIYASHGSAVDPDIIERVRTVAEIIALPSIEARRAAIERLGWAQYIAQANPPIVDVAPDPGNFPHVLELYDAPVEFQGMFRLLRMVNGSDERNAGDRRQFVELIPTSITSALAAAAWQFDCPVAEYAKVHRRT